MMDINDDDHDRSWSKLPKLAINSIACNLNSVDHVRFRSICTGWHSSTQEREKAPLVILMDRDNEGDTIKALSFFDIVGQEIIPLRPLASEAVADSYYLGSAIGWIFIGNVFLAPNSNQEELTITLLNPFTDVVIISPPLLTSQRRGRVFLVYSPRHLRDNYLTVVYYVDIDDNGRPAQVNFIRLGPPGHENQWTTFWLDELPNDVIAMAGLLCANYKGVLMAINLETQRLVGMNMLLPGLFPALSSDPALFLRFFVDLRGELHVFFTTSYRRSSYCFKMMSARPMENLSLFFYKPPVDLTIMPPTRNLVILEDLSVVLQYDNPCVHVDDYSPFRLLLRLSTFWNNGQNQWEPVGWITPALIRYDQDQVLH
ncbi:F-box domain-containing protein [Dioscorea alata]|uniref:F-box domain-containing protein n=1 Tax=Dioscorea alata TaxID=55571 RepID=A0ACB7UE58_DIOAL|nr:F-box domain-containing protein [Dioscorea alata]